MKILTGKVISKKMGKTATVAVERIVVHPLYKKRFKRIKKYHIQDEQGVEIGQVVKFVASRPYSKLKRWKVVGVEGLDKKLPNKKVRGKGA
jgi:small subunit ribosomal protein S17